MEAHANWVNRIEITFDSVIVYATLVDIIYYGGLKESRPEQTRPAWPTDNNMTIAPLNTLQYSRAGDWQLFDHLSAIL